MSYHSGLCQIGYMDHAGCHQASSSHKLRALTTVVTAVVTLARELQLKRALERK
jgi:hypothetical protein